MMLAGKTVVITGSAHGIGKCITQKCIEAGAKVWALDINEKALADLQLEAQKWGHELFTKVTDVSSKASLDEAKTTILQSNTSIDVWINNAGISGLGDFQKTPFEKIEQVIQINLIGALYGTRLALEQMEVQGRGTIVNIASIAGHVSVAYLAAYCASKYGVVGFSRAIRQELDLHDSNVKLLTISPGFVDTGMIERGTNQGFPEWLSFLLCTPEKVAEAVMEAIRNGTEESYPTFNGKMILGMNKILPSLTRRTSRLLLAKSVRDVLLLRKQPPK